MTGGDASVKWTSETRIAGIQGDSSEKIQDHLTFLANSWRLNGARVVGLVEEHTEGLPKACGGSVLRNLVSGTHHRLYQDLGPYSTACCLDPAGVAESCAAILDHISGADLVILSKFGKLEAEGGGLIAAFVCAAEHDKPVLTSVAPPFTKSYLEFVGPLGAIIPAD
ncbi:DUF2478 domain-containing protein [Hyphomicrobium sp. LHD-15]|uniref:DUF2478 domain-containing protein n=1 Tax=Hyphomicrobium sp. LHD-15 TaxID=3072142 RepID=UPI00280C4C94|nr:DUF2478 domain-containing protein [Hyphomicrobium sp. LHD-15]MDQ8700850.1 DUF2478 domain-containing protein [Hyphomicrobium sp. LHD-15]